MSFQSYLDNVEKQTGKTPNDFIALAAAKGFDKTTKAGEIMNWLKTNFALGHGHAAAMTHVIRNGAYIGDKHVGKPGPHGDESDTLRLDGIDKR